MQALERFTEAARDHLAQEIEDNDGGEVFALCTMDEDLRICEIVVVARGSESEVAALGAYFEDCDILVHNHPSGMLAPSDADVHISSEAASFGVGSYIVDNTVSRVRVVAEPSKYPPLVEIDEAEIASAFEEGGKLAAILGQFETRKSQVDLAADIASAFNAGSIMAAEAGTGVGKTFAYLVPALAWCIRNKQRIVISTATINLQMQLIEKDIPIVQSIFKKKTKAVLVKGRGNYLCLLRLKEAVGEARLPGMEDESDAHLLAIDEWSRKTIPGDRSDLPSVVEDSLWSRVNAEIESCTGIKCPLRADCFFFKARKNAADADLIVANHHILFSDLSARIKGRGYDGTAVLPAFKSIIIDEAHSVEASATSFFSSHLVTSELRFRLGRLSRKKGRRLVGLFPQLGELNFCSTQKVETLNKLHGQLQSGLLALEQASLRLLAHYSGAEKTTTLRLPTRTKEIEQDIIAPMKTLEASFTSLCSALEEILEECPPSSNDSPEMQATRSTIKQLSSTVLFLADFQKLGKDPSIIFWLEKLEGRGGSVRAAFHMSPLDITKIMHEALYSKMRSIVLTSATLTVGGSFDYWKHRTGLAIEKDKLECAIYPSPFPFSTNALCAIDASAPAPQSPTWTDYLCKAVYSLVSASQGHALVLFTSWTVLTEVCAKVIPPLQKSGLTCLTQGSMDRARLLDVFKSDISSVLFATDSFWEGIDAPGETLQLVIITRLPFRVPNDPVHEARGEALEAKGGSPFMQIALPEAIIRFKQGFGRLIRHSDDRGVAAILDSRVTAKSYGEIFLSSLPTCRQFRGSTQEIAHEISHFLFDY